MEQLSYKRSGKTSNSFKNCIGHYSVASAPKCFEKICRHWSGRRAASATKWVVHRWTSTLPVDSLSIFLSFLPPPLLFFFLVHLLFPSFLFDTSLSIFAFHFRFIGIKITFIFFFCQFYCHFIVTAVPKVTPRNKIIPKWKDWLYMEKRSGWKHRHKRERKVTNDNDTRKKMSAEKK